MIYYNSSTEVPELFLCKFCQSICDITLTCVKCDRLICYECVAKADQNQQYDCSCQQNLDCIPEIVKGYYLGFIYIKCQYCGIFQNYLKYQKHLKLCQKLHGLEIVYQNNFHLLERTPVNQKNCQICKQNQYSIYVCEDCKRQVCQLCKDNIASLLIQDICASNQHTFIKEESQSYQMYCLFCNIIVSSEILLKHFKKCYYNQSQNQEFQFTNLQIIYPSFQSNYMKSKEEAIKLQDLILQSLKVGRDSQDQEQIIINLKTIMSKQAKRLMQFEAELTSSRKQNSG